MAIPVSCILYPVSLLLAIPLGLILKSYTTHEPQIYSQKIYFPTIQKILTIISAITISQNKPIFLASTFLLITIYTWNK